MNEKNANIFFFTGSHTQKLESFLKNWTSQFQEKHGEYNLTALDVDSENFTFSEFANAVSAPPFLGEKRLVVVRGFPFSSEKKITKNKEEIEQGIMELLKNIPETTIVVFFSPSADMRRKTSKEMEKNAEVKKMEWNSTSKEELIYTKVGKITNVQMRQFLFDYVGDDPLRISSELDKLVIFADGEAVSREDIEQCIIPDLEESVFTLLDAVSVKNSKKALQVFERIQLSGQDLFAVSNMLIWQFEHLFYVKELTLAKKSDAEIMSITGMKPYPLQKNKQLLSRYSLDLIKQALEMLYTFDVRIKTGIIKTTQEESESLAGALQDTIVALTLL